jgi:hypothetical protein
VKLTAAFFLGFFTGLLVGIATALIVEGGVSHQLYTTEDYSEVVWDPHLERRVA